VSAQGVPAKGVGIAWPQWLEDLYQIADRLDAAGFAAKVGDRGTMRFGNGPTLVGVDEIAGGVGELFSAITAMSHRPIRLWQDGADVIFEAIVSYGCGNGTTVEIPSVTAYTRDDDGTLHGRIYCDLAPVFANAR
jgi:hypothetical protein